MVHAMLNAPTMPSFDDALPAVDAIVIGGSLGAIEALGILLPEVQPRARIPVITVVHLPPDQRSILPELFEPRCSVPTFEPADKEPIRGGAIWFAPPGYHLLVENDRSFALSVDEPVRFSRPSIDVLFESAADVYGARLAGIVLTGANDDGALGARAIRRSGGYVIVQDPLEAKASRMPLAAVSRSAPQKVARLTEIAGWIRAITRGST